MCLLAFALDAHPHYRVVVAANRDEAYDRPATPLAWWSDAPTVLAGRDLQAGGTWMGVTREGRWAALTNVRAPNAPRHAERSRGALVRDALTGAAPAAETAQAIHRQRDRYDGFNLVVSDPAETAVVSTRTDRPVRLGAGVYGLSNDALDTPWPKVVRARRALRALLGQDEIAAPDLLALLDDTDRPPDAELPDTGVGLDWERCLAPIRIQTEGYGTRVSTALLIRRDGTVEVTERTWTPDGASDSRSVRFTAEAPLHVP